MSETITCREVDRAAAGEWLRVFETVRDVESRGFVAFGAAWNIDRGLPGTVKFAYPAGGIAHPHHADGLPAGAWFWVSTFAEGTPDELAAEATWRAGEFVVNHGPWGIGKPLRNVTLAEALDYTIALADHYRQHCIVPDVARDDAGRVLYTLRAAEWAELRDAFPVPAGVQIGMFDDPIQGPYALCRRAIRDELAARSVKPDEPVAIQDRLALAQLQDLIDWVNRERPVPAFAWGGAE